MTWQKLTSSGELIVLQRRNRGYKTRIEARNESEKWTIYFTRFNDTGLNLTEEFEATTREDMEKIVHALKHKPVSPLKNLTKNMLQSKKKSNYSLQRAFKEYNVEKWSFKMQDDHTTNFVTIRYCDSVDMDFVMHQKYQKHEDEVIAFVNDSLGIDQSEEDINVQCFYYTHDSKHSMGAPRQKIIMGKLEFSNDE